MQAAESGSRQSCKTFAVSNPLHIEHACVWVHVFVFSPTFTLSCRVCRTQKGSSFIMCVGSPSLWIQASSQFPQILKYLTNFEWKKPILSQGDWCIAMYLLVIWCCVILWVLLGSEFKMDYWLNSGSVRLTCKGCEASYARKKGELSFWIHLFSTGLRFRQF